MLEINPCISLHLFSAKREGEMMKLHQIKQKYLSGEISKPDYIDDMHAAHTILFDYARFIRNTDIAKIEITDDAIVMTSRETGIRILCDKDDKRIVPVEILNFEQYESGDSALIFQMIKDDAVVFDIGANIGWYSLNIAKKYPSSNVVAFEPIPKTFDYLTENISLNEVKNIRINNLGLSNKAGEFVFYYYEGGSGNASSANLTGGNDVKEIKCKVTTLDEYATSENLSVDFIKCDVEGAELLVFQGGIETIRRCTPIVFTEMLRKWSAKFNYHPNEILGLFSGLGYRCFTAKDSRLTEFFSMDEETQETNFFFMHGKHADIIRRFA
jgi:FkbM family methyltransferase